MELQKRILSFGNIVMDGIYHLDHIPGHDEKVFAQEVRWEPGGPAVHFANQAATLGIRANVLGWVGNDSLGSQLLHKLEANKVESSLQMILNEQTPSAIIMVDTSGEKAVVLSPLMDEARLPAPDEVALFDLKGFQHLHTHLFLKKYVDAMLLECRRAQITTSLDVEPSSVRRWGVEATLESIALTNVIFANELSIKVLMPEAETIVAAMKQLYELGPSIIICTRGKKGCAVYCTEGYREYGAIEVTTTNSLAAGDIFASVFINHWVNGATIPQAVCFATASSAVAVTRSYHSVYYPTQVEIEQMLSVNGQHLLTSR